MCEPQPRDRGRHEAREGSREGTDPDGFAALAGEGRELRVGELEAPRDVVRVFEQHRAGVRQAQPAAPALEQADADLGLEQGDLMRDRRLRQRHLSRRRARTTARERRLERSSTAADP